MGYISDHFVQADLIGPYLEGLSSRTPSQEALRLLLQCGGDEALREAALHASRSVDVIGSEDPDILVFIFHWILVAGNPEEVIACARLARSLDTDASNVNPLAFILANEAMAYAELHDYPHFLSSGQEALQVARRARTKIQMRVVAILAPTFVLMGCRSMIQKDLERAQQNNPPPDVRDRFLIADLIEATEAFRVDEANRILERLSHGHEAPPYAVSHAYFMQEMLQAYVSLFPGQKPAPFHTPFDSSSTSPDEQKEAATMRAICDHLHNRRPAEALQAVYAMHKNRGEPLFSSPGTKGYFLVRAELSNGNLNAARRALNVRKDAGLKHPLDAFFHARIALLQQDPGSAKLLFRECLSGMAALNARNRLLFELALSNEIPIPVLMEWTRFLNEPAFRRKSPAKRIEPPVDLPPLSSGRQPKSNMSQRLIRHVTPGVTRLIGQSREMENVRQFIRRISHKDAPVLITGQTGTGKDVVARAIHEESSRTAHPFMAINCASLGENLLSSELFGHERGAFTGASERNQGLIRAAGKGTLFLDEIGEITPNMQAALLRVLETGEFRPVGSSRILAMECRIIAATNRDLPQEVQAGRFREDLFYRLRRLEIHLSPLGQRKEDISPLAHFFFDWDRTGSERVRVHADLEAALWAYAWPGNVRELRNTVDRLRLFHGDKTEYGLVDLLDVMPDWKAGVHKPETLDPKAPANLPSASPAAGNDYAGGPSRESERSLLRLEEAVLHLFQRHTKLTRKELMKALNLSPNTATKYIQRLIEAGTIVRITPSRSSRSDYFQWAQKPTDAGPS